MSLVQETFDFSPDFQDLVLACLVRHPQEFLKYGSILEARFFPGVQATLVAQCILDSFKDKHRFPTWAVVEQMAVNRQKKMGGDETTAERMATYVAKLRKLDTSDVDYVTGQVVQFAKERATLAAIKANIADIQEGKIDEKFIHRLEAALAIGQDLDDLGYLLHRDAEKAVRKIVDVHYGIRTGFPILDEIWRTGLAPGWLVILLAPPKRFKTLACVNMALNMVSPGIGEDVIYYSCEISQELALARILFNLTGLTNDYMFASTEKFIQRAKDRIAETIEGHLIIKGYPSKSVSILDLKNHARTCIRQLGIKPKAIFIDYAETVKHSDRQQSEHQQSASVYTEARAMGHELGCAVIMPDRCNKETVGMRVPNMTSFQGAFQKAGIVDIAIGQCSTEAEYINNILRWFVFENRHGPAYQHIRGRVDPEIMRIEMLEKIPYDPDEGDEVGKKLRRRRDGEGTLPKELQE